MAERQRIDPSKPARDWDLSHILIENDLGQAIAAFTDVFRRAGARTVEWGYRGIGPDDREPVPGEPTTWYVEIERRLPDGRTEKLTAEQVAMPGGMTHEQAQLEAAAKLVRQLGGKARIEIGNFQG